MHTYKILLVDDNETSLKLLKAIYEADYDVVTARDGLEALEALFQYKIDLVISDVLMPNMDGYHLSYKIRTNNRLKDIPIIIYTATYTSQSEESVAKDMGATVYLRKPSPVKLLSTIAKEILAEPENFPHKTPTEPESVQMMKQYSGKLISKLEQSNIELEEQVRQRTAALEQFSYSVSHDLRTPLQIINGYSYVLIKKHGGHLNDDAKELLQGIKNYTNQMAKLIEDLLNFSRLGNAELARKEVDMNVVVKAVIQDLKSVDTNFNVEIKLGNLKPATCDERLVRQVWMNLISNAIKYSGKKEKPVIEIGLVEVNNEDVYFVKDNGAGFDMQFADKLFSTFQRLHSDSEFEGTGIGLALVKSLVSKHGGKIWAEGRVEEGATFYFTLPSVQV